MARRSIVGRAALVAGLVAASTSAGAAQGPPPPEGTDRWVRPGYYKELSPERWRERVQQMLKTDAVKPPPKGAVLFIGSATIAGWDLEHYFPEYKTIKRGLGGSLVSEATYYLDPLVVPVQPSTIVFYSGDNDLGYGMTPEMVARDFAAFVKKVHAALPATHVVVFSIRPSIARWAVHEQVFAANARMAALAAKDRRLHFVDMTPLLVGPDGQPRRELLRDDLHHLNQAGFDLVTEKIRPVIAQAEAAHARPR